MKREEKKSPRILTNCDGAEFMIIEMYGDSEEGNFITAKHFGDPNKLIKILEEYDKMMKGEATK